MAPLEADRNVLVAVGDLKVDLGRLSPRSTLPIFTMPPRRTRFPGAALLAAMSVGELEKTI